MTRHSIGSADVLAVVIAFAWAAPITLAGQTQDAKAKPAAASSSYKAPRTPDGQPDLQGVWANNMATPLERPKQLANKPVLTDKELADFKNRAARLFDGGGDAAFGDGLYNAVAASLDTFVSQDGKTGDYNQFWLVDREWENRTSLVVDPPDGRIPALTPEGQNRQAADAEHRKLHPADGPEDLSLSVRCITYGVPRLGGLNAGYNSYYQIFQSKDVVAISSEMIHETRLIPLDGRPHVSSNLRQWQGDSRGHWEGDTLVIDTTNFSPKTNYQGSRANLHIVERFTRVAPDTLDYQVRVEDPTTWTKPWSALIKLKHSKDEIYEFACHEGNIGMKGILAGARAEEKAATEAAKKDSK